jgi:XisH protein
MPAKDIFHDCVKSALIKDGWTITHDPFSLRIGKKDLFIDLGAEKLLAAEKADQKIAIEIKSFISPSGMRDLENAIGQYVVYQNVLSLTAPERLLYLAIRESTFINLFQDELGKLLLERQKLKIITFDSDREEITQWII